ncbi:MAG: cation:dicarboxylase symporter family transporter [Komagataeibacter hansenii]|uniref:Aerobic C4-dicarboxylate transport protein n=1 Tax=Komagataeibacter saccharivorans TaxID=265959 RepID=A0A347WF13_9PROT|nr:cation:dicarboxylase symporter family transporter [Komagataeibacter saccharivorans]MBL7237692.1 cation:dicarboxylase symporter family transporter [Novacetimonas hansenii]AXY23456.1 Aerobic C4-dicarboxylate transport protein [Komagataeibacter saccharivorans]PYD50259.1 C4-dicarboxylate transporter DctA [Komagataeibacter saccharivorans]QBL92647.1 Aerobic C4-dicarboxylate transport protein [Komagataeibacter saccharivorans]GBQ39803.1 C4-dicarboxylate transport protein [Komagataeibacter sacchariv
MRFCRSLFFQIVLATVLGVTLGLATPGIAVSLKPLSDLFLRLIAMLVGPLVFCVVVQGIAGAGNLRTVGRIGLKALVYFEVTTTIALCLGVAAAAIFQPGAGMNIDAGALTQSLPGQFGDSAATLRHDGLVGFLLHLVPQNPLSAFVHNDVLQVLVFAILFGCGLSMAGEQGKPAAALIDSVAAVLFRIMGMVIRVAPIGVLGAIAYTVGHFGAGSLGQLGVFVALYSALVAVFVLVGLGLLLRLCGISIFSFIWYLRTELTVVLATTSSDAVLPQIMEKLAAIGIPREVVGLVIPTGYSFNLDALSIYLGLAVLFLAQASGVHLTWTQIFLVTGTALVTSKGAHGVPGVAIVILAATLAVVPEIPPVGLVLLVAVDWFIGIARALGNVMGNCIATIAVAKWEGRLDVATAQRVLRSARSGQ